MATVEVSFEGGLNYVFANRLNKFGKHSVNFYPKDAETRKAVKAAGLRSGIKEDQNGNFYYVFRRDPDNKYSGGPVLLVDTEGNEVTKPLAEGTEGIVYLDVYDYNSDEHGQGKGGRLKKIVITKLVEYVKPVDGDAPNKVEGVPGGVDGNDVGQVTQRPKAPF
jgi:hypothetical protein